MRFQILLSILCELLEKGKTTAPALAKKHQISVRTVYRYIDKLSPVLPLKVLRGREGGVFLDERFTLPSDFLTEEEYEGVEVALAQAYAATAEERYLSARRKLAKRHKKE